MAVGAEHGCHLHESDADSGRLAVAQGLRTDEKDAAQLRPFTFSIIVWSFHVRDP